MPKTKTVQPDHLAGLAKTETEQSCIQISPDLHCCPLSCSQLGQIGTRADEKKSRDCTSTIITRDQHRDIIQTPHHQQITLHDTPLLSLSASPHVRAAGPLSHLAGPIDDALHRQSGPVDGGPHVEIEDGLSGRLRWARVVVDNVAHLARRILIGQLALHVLVVAVEWHRAAARTLSSAPSSKMEMDGLPRAVGHDAVEKAVQPGPGRDAAATALGAHQLRHHSGTVAVGGRLCSQWRLRRPR